MNDDPMPVKGTCAIHRGLHHRCALCVGWTPLTAAPTDPEMCVCGEIETAPIHSKEYCFSGIEGAHEFTPAAPTGSTEPLWPKIPPHLADPIVFEDKNLGICLLARQADSQWIYRIHNEQWCSVRKVDASDPLFVTPLNKLGATNEAPHCDPLPKVEVPDDRPPQPPDHQEWHSYFTNLAPYYIAEQIFYHVFRHGGAGNPLRSMNSKWFCELAAPKIRELLTAGSPSEAPQTCAYRFPDRICAAPICKDIQSYSGWSHVHKADWMHWASPTPYDHVGGDAAKIFVPCTVCDQFGPDNEEHVLIDGHRFVCAKVGSTEEAKGEKPQHKSVPVQVWADIDAGVAEWVRWLNTIPGIRTFASCQGTIGEGGAHPYHPYVKAWWPEEVDEIIVEKFHVSDFGKGWCDIYLKPGAKLSHAKADSVEARQDAARTPEEK